MSVSLSNKLLYMQRKEGYDRPMSGLDCGRERSRAVASFPRPDAGAPFLKTTALGDRSTRASEEDSAAARSQSDQSNLNPRVEEPAAVRTCAEERSEEKLGGKKGNFGKTGTVTTKQAPRRQRGLSRISGSTCSKFL